MSRRWPLLAGWGSTTETVVDALGGGPLVSPWQAAKLQRIAKGDFSTQFALSLALKDVRLAQAADDDRFAALACLADEWQQAVDHGLGEQDLTVVTRALDGLPWRRPFFQLDSNRNVARLDVGQLLGLVRDLDAQLGSQLPEHLLQVGVVGPFAA